MNADRRKVLVACTVIRARLQELQLDAALAATLEKAGVQVTEVERRQLLRDAEAVLAGSWPDEPRQIEIAM
mgnify:FL=1|jgi:hypothetical protein